jgi:hypothetical protein
MPERHDAGQVDGLARPHALAHANLGLQTANLKNYDPTVSWPSGRKLVAVAR